MIITSLPEIKNVDDREFISHGWIVTINGIQTYLNIDE